MILTGTKENKEFKTGIKPKEAHFQSDTSSKADQLVQMQTGKT